MCPPQMLKNIFFLFRIHDKIYFEAFEMIKKRNCASPASNWHSVQWSLMEFFFFLLFANAKYHFLRQSNSKTIFIFGSRYHWTLEQFICVNHVHQCSPFFLRPSHSKEDEKDKLWLYFNELILPVYVRLYVYLCVIMNAFINDDNIITYKSIRNQYNLRLMTAPNTDPTAQWRNIS